jgi:protein-L-isoaspartate(D-aspartate) O-methyltransferase
MYAAALVVITLFASTPFAAEQQALVAAIRDEVRETRYFTGIDSLDERVLDALGRVPRHEFVPAELREFAWDDTPLPIGEGQTISQPFVVALMSHLARVAPESVVLEVGTGSGYQAAVLASLAKRVYTIEIVESLGREATRVLARLGYDNVEVRIGDGYAGWPEVAPFDAIVVTAAPESVPAPLVRQLKPGGRLVIPVGGQREGQSLQVIEKRRDGEVATTDVLPVMFVPLTRGAPR